MKKIIASLALSAALGTGFAAGAHAQTVQGNGGIYALTVTETTTLLAPSDYLYSYEVTLTSDPSNTAVTQFGINNIKGYIAGSRFANDEVRGDTLYATDFGTNPIIVTPSGSTTGISFSASNGFVTPGLVPVIPGSPGAGEGDTVTFGFQSTLPPTAKVSLSSNGQNADSNFNNGNLAGTGSSTGPGKPTIPETSSFALLGLGLLPLGMLARRRIARNS